MALTFKVEADNYQNTISGLLNASKYVQNKWVEQQAEHVYELSQIYVPRDTGTLARSGHVSRATREGDSKVSRVTYGGSSPTHPRRPKGPWYAIKVHEEPTYHLPPTRWKYLESAYLQVQPRMVPAFIAKIKAAIADWTREMHRAAR